MFKLIIGSISSLIMKDLIINNISYIPHEPYSEFIKKNILEIINILYIKIKN